MISSVQPHTGIKGIYVEMVVKPRGHRWGVDLYQPDPKVIKNARQQSTPKGSRIFNHSNPTVQSTQWGEQTHSSKSSLSKKALRDIGGTEQPVQTSVKDKRSTKTARSRALPRTPRSKNNLEIIQGYRLQGIDGCLRHANESNYLPTTPEYAKGFGSMPTVSTNTWDLSTASPKCLDPTNQSPADAQNQPSHMTEESRPSSSMNAPRLGLPTVPDYAQSINDAPVSIDTWPCSMPALKFSKTTEHRWSQTRQINECLTPKSKRSFILLLSALLAELGIDPSKRGVTMQLQSVVERAGNDMSDDTIRKIVREVAELRA